MDNCIFCKIIKKELPATIIYESSELIAFPDINPSADFHLLIVPKEHIEKIADVSKDHGNLLGEIMEVANNQVIENNLTDKAYRIVVNGGKAQHVPHLHFHLLGGNLKNLV